MQNTLYAILGVEPTANAEAIEAAYLEQTQLQDVDADALSLLRIASDTLRQAETRAAYDRKLAKLAASNTIVYDSGPPRAARSGSMLALLLFFAVFAAGYWWWKVQSNKPREALPSHAQTSPQGQFSAPEAELAPSTVNEASVAIPDPVAPSGEPRSARAPRVEMVMPTRGARKPGFDVEYLAWSAFQIRQRNSAGSGVLIGPDRILTNCHVLAGGANNGLVVIHSLTRKVSKVEKYARLDGEDACLLFAPGAGGEVIEWGASANLRTGETVYTLGHPGASRDLIWSEAQFIQTVTLGGNSFLQTSNYCRPGSSGGPLLDGEGRLVGIVTSVQVAERPGEGRQYGACQSVTEVTARALLSKPLFPIGFAPATYEKNY